MKFLWSRKQEGKRTQDKASTTTVTRVADTALKRYEKTFKDLARYDRGERPSPVSR